MKFLDPTSSVFNRYTGGGRKKIKTDPLPDPVPTQQAVDEQALEAGEAERRRLARRKGRRSTIFPEGELGTSSTQRASVLGDVGVA